MSGWYSDPTANTALANVDREIRRRDRMERERKRREEEQAAREKALKLPYSKAPSAGRWWFSKD